MPANSLDNLCVNDHGIESNEVWYVLPDLTIFIQNIEYFLLMKRDTPIGKFHNQRILIRLFMKPMT